MSVSLLCPRLAPCHLPKRCHSSPALLSPHPPVWKKAIMVSGHPSLQYCQETSRIIVRLQMGEAAETADPSTVQPGRAKL